MGAGTFEIAFTDSALEDMASFRKREQATVLDRCEEQLSHQPNVETRNRKKLRPNRVAEWELRIDAFRVFYDIDVEARSVEVKAIGRKRGNSLFFRGEKFEL